MGAVICNGCDESLESASATFTLIAAPRAFPLPNSLTTTRPAHLSPHNAPPLCYFLQKSRTGCVSYWDGKHPGEARATETLSIRSPRISGSELADTLRLTVLRAKSSFFFCVVLLKPLMSDQPPCWSVAFVYYVMTYRRENIWKERKGVEVIEGKETEIESTQPERIKLLHSKHLGRRHGHARSPSSFPLFVFTLVFPDPCDLFPAVLTTRLLKSVRCHILCPFVVFFFFPRW